VQTLALDNEIPMGAILYFLAQAYLMPSLGQFKEQGRAEQDWVVEMQAKITHPLTAERLQQIAAAIGHEAEAKECAMCGCIWTPPDCNGGRHVEDQRPQLLQMAPQAEPHIRGDDPEAVADRYVRQRPRRCMSLSPRAARRGTSI